ncbi:MAG TPA: hypothetical protein VLG40_01010 [Candidatus Saccharimonas sp.]|nr:hypothetical protein [Candidatus Saccharimonas sp.]
MRINRRIILIVGGIVIVTLLGLAIFSQAQKIGKVTVDVVVAPAEAKLTIDGQSAQPGTNYVTPGKHTFKASLALFSDAVQTIDTKTWPTNKKIYLVPFAASPQAVQWLIDHKDASTQMQSAGDAQAALKNRQIQQTYPYLAQLPFVALDFRIDYSLDSNTNQISFIITAKPYASPQSDAVDYNQQIKDFNAEAIAQLKKLGVNTDKATITYKVQDPLK